MKSQLVSSTNSSITIEVEIDQNQLHSYISEQNKISYYQSVVVAVPADGDISLAGLNLGNQKSLNTKLQSSQIVTPSKIVEFSEPLYVRGRKLVTVHVFPVTQNGVYEQVEFSLQFSGTTTANKNKLTESPFEKILSSTVLNYEQSKQFALKPNRSFATASASGPFSQSTDWIKIEIDQTGLYKLTGAQLDASGMSISGQLSSSIHLYNGGGKQLPVPNEVAKAQFNEIAIKIVDDNDDGIFDSNDYILFYGESLNRFGFDTTNYGKTLNRWAYDTSQFIYNAHNYDERNIYWLNRSSASSGLRIDAVDASLNGVVGGSTIQTFDRYTRRMHVEQNNILRRWSNNKVTDYYNWYWTNENDLSFFVSTEHLVPNDTVKAAIAGITGLPIGSDNIEAIDFYVNGTLGLDPNCSVHSGCTYSSTSFVDGSNSIDVSIEYFPISPPYLNYLELSYTAYNQPINNQLDLPFGALSGKTEIEVINTFTSNPLILDISNPFHPVEMQIPSYGVNMFSFYDDLSPTKLNRYFLMPASSSLTPKAISSVATNDLYVTSNQTDLIIISPKSMQTSLSEYVNYRSSKGYAIQLVSIEEIMDNFGFGVYDPTAIRDFLKFSYENYAEPKPSGVLFVGDANYDFLNNLSTNMPNYVPPFTHQDDNTSSDDNYVFFGDFGILDSDTSYDSSVNSFNKGFDMMSARWPIRTSSDIQAITDKIISYESSNNFGSWRNKITLVADDEYGSHDNEYFHTTQTEQLEQYHLPQSFSRNKIYLWEYPFVNGEKPEVNDKIVNSFNDGSLLINYVGHGSPDVWAHENVFERAGDLPRLQNPTTLPLVVAASCAIGFYDDPLREGMAEELLAMPLRGVIGVISATRVVYSAPNAQFNKELYNVLFDNKSHTICEAMYAAKLIRQYVGPIPRPQFNDRNYLYFGGPFVKLGKPQYKINFSTPPDSLIALGQTQVVGTVVDYNGVMVTEDGTIEINVLDSKRDKTYQLKNANGGVTNEIDYSVNGPTIFRGSASVKNGEFDFSFVSPLDIGFGGEGAQISVYASFNSVDASGVIDSISISDSIASTNDSLGPEVDVAFTDHQNFISGDFINTGESLVLKLSDESGINLAGGLGHGITLEIDNQPEKLLNLTSYFKYDQDQFNRGSLEFPLEDLGAGVHSFKVKAWDNANNFAKIEFDAEIKSHRELQIVNLLNYPNPMRESTRFSFSLTQSVDNFVLDVFTLSGKKIKTFSRRYLEPSYYDDIIWYGNDVDGDRVATEVYIYKATAYPSDGSEKVESFGKIILVN